MTDQFVPDGEAVGEGVEHVDVAMDDTSAEAVSLQTLLDERTADLQRLQAEYVNYKRRVDRDRDVARQRGVEAVMLDFMPVLDSIQAAQAHEPLTDGERLIAEQVGKVTTKYGLVAYGAVGDPFDPQIHDALMHVHLDGYSVESISQVFQLGYKLGDRVIRAARVAVTDPSETAAVVEADAVPDDVSSLTEPDD